MRVLDISKLKEGDKFLYKGEEAVITWKRPKEDHLSIGYETEDKSVCITFRTACDTVTLVSRLDSKGTRFEDRKGVSTEVLVGLDLPDYQPAP